MSMSNASETALLNLLFNNTDWANVGDAAGDPWTADPTTYGAGTAGASLVAAGKALQLCQFLALK